MTPPRNFKTILACLSVLILAQVACSLGASSAGPSPQPYPAPTTAVPSGSQRPARATVAEALAMLKEAVQHYNTVGRAKALTDFTGRVAPFFDRDLYVACIDSNLAISANGGFPNLVGSRTEPLSRAAWDAATTTKVGSVNYDYTDPATGKTEPKTFYYQKVGSDVCGVGVYHP